jgi:hypothetical protein
VLAGCGSKVQDGVTIGLCGSVAMTVKQVTQNEFNILRLDPGGLATYQAMDFSIRKCIEEGEYPAPEKTVTSREEDRSCHFAEPLRFLKNS